MIKKNRGQYDHIKSFEDFKNEKVRIYYEIQYIQKKLQLRYMNYTSYATNPSRLIPILIARWVAPMLEGIQDIVTGLFKRNKGDKNAEI